MAKVCFNLTSTRLFKIERERRPVEGSDVPSRALARRTDTYNEDRDDDMERELFQDQRNSGINFSRYDRIPVQKRGQNIPHEMQDVHSLSQFTKLICSFNRLDCIAS